MDEEELHGYPLEAHNAELVINADILDEFWEPQKFENDKMSLQTRVWDAFSHRAEFVRYEPKQGRAVHHFNWNGDPVYEPSGTEPCISLFYLLSAPKVLHPRDDLRIQATMSRATHFVDPVLVFLESGVDDLTQTGSDLVNFAAGRTFKTYSPHGKWTEDEKERQDGTLMDDGEIDSYFSSRCVVGNGFIQQCPIPSRKQRRADMRRQEATRSHRRTSLGTMTYRPSPLRYSISADEIESPPVESDNAEHSMSLDPPYKQDLTLCQTFQGENEGLRPAGNDTQRRFYSTHVPLDDTHSDKQTHIWKHLYRKTWNYLASSKAGGRAAPIESQAAMVIMPSATVQKRASTARFSVSRIKTYLLSGMKTAVCLFFNS
ncbi:hypothetical protein ASPZODRAFT_126822 [Penicilliopsis zonata CBS 506.65]|uniref:Uncharacterized protein n=1 Tax=Penicilliopsis zonata CBS 506.65 TaxID=1073090 RepID=A0A1L9SUS4_9EURO|nr:hypothetical protein ASPZODRAFT_126822 [Penicilliopsis zonata CBS 506.65]OJJ50864.1 hypothetical protein ASPZODRAFT_126822 [Penicilliopsis zonata CBS 506.65]